MDNLTRLALLVNKIAGLRNEQTIGAITPPRVADILDMLVMFANNGEIPTTDVPGADEISDEDAQAFEEMFSKVEVDRANKLLRIKDHDDIFVCPVEQLLAPAAPTYGGTAYPSTSPLVSTVNSQSISLTNNASGSTIMWTILAENGDTSSTDSQPQDPRDAASSPSTGTSVTLQNIIDNETRTYKIWAVAKKNGMFNNATNDLKITIVAKRKVATPTINESVTTFDTSRNITLACGTSGASIYYTTDGTAPSAENGTLYSAPFPLTSSADTPVSTNVRAIAVLEDWESSDTASKSVTVGAKKTYIGFSTKATLSSASDIQDLQLSLKRTSPEKNHLYTVTQNTNGATGYIWICCTDTINYGAVFATADAKVDMGFNAAQVVNGWNCYRIGAAINETSTTLIILS